MPRTNFFFKRNEFSDPEIKKPYYTYLGDFLEHGSKPGTDSPRHPISLYFGKDEISICYTTDNAEILKVFSLYVAGGTINQDMLSKKVEDYATMPFWPVSTTEPLQKQKETKKKVRGRPLLTARLREELERLCVDPTLLHVGYFGNYFGFQIIGDRVSKINLPGSREQDFRIEDGNTLVFTCKKKAETDNKINEDTWTLKDGKIKASKINFLKILLDFLFELDFANTFEDENFFQLQPHLQNNLVLDALTKKCRYLTGLNELRHFSQETRKPILPKPFRDAEKEWLNVCRLEEYIPVFVSPHSLFDDPETEVKNVFFEARVGEGRKKRRQYLKNKDDAQLKNDICTFFMRKYDIWSAFRILASRCGIFLFPFILLAIPLGDYFLPDQFDWYKPGISSIGLPLAILCFMFAYYTLKGINFFKLLLPRLFLGIMVGWAAFWSTEELWKKALSTDFKMVLLFDVFLFIIIFLYIFTDIGNRLYRKMDRQVICKTITLIGMAFVISFVMGFYVVQFYAKPMLENADFLKNKRLYNEGSGPAFDDFEPGLDEFFSEKSDDNQKEWRLQDHIKYFYKGEDESHMKIENFKKVPIKFPIPIGSIRYIWSILFSQFLVSILFGIVLQLLWEDRPITEPL